MTFFFRFFAIGLLLSDPFFPTQAWAEEVDVSRVYMCDDLFCPDSNAQPVPASDHIQQNTGISVSGFGDQFPKMKRVVIDLDSISSATSPPRYAQPQVQPIGASGDGSGAYSRAQSRSQQDGQSSNDVSTSSTGESRGYSPEFSNSGVTGQSGFSGSTSNGGGKVRGGYIYSGASESGATFEGRSQTNSSFANSENAQSALNAVALNRKQQIQQSATQKSTASSRSGTLGSALSGVGSANSTNKEQERQNQPNGLDRLSEYASSLGEKFFAALGLSGGSKAKRGSQGFTGSASKLKQPTEKQLAFDRDMLKKQYARYQRGLASHPELGGSNTFLFENVCLHYDQYARSNNIPLGRSTCPKQ